ncbi:MAG: response regulator [Clostridia bacterium]|nr:response regulator [Clostridia bacterium]
MLKVLIVDDNYEYLEALFNSLNEQINKELKIVKICNDGEKALNYIMNDTIDIILLDLNLPKVNGIEVLETMKKNNIHSKIIIMSGEADFVVDLIRRKLNVYQTFIKPFKIEDLINTLNNIVLESLEDNNCKKISNILEKFNFNKNSMGYIYIQECLNFCVENNYKFIPQIKVLYKKISEKYDNIPYSNIAWDISKSIQIMNKTTNTLIFNKYFPYSTYPSPKTFLNGILNIYYNK